MLRTLEVQAKSMVFVPSYGKAVYSNSRGKEVLWLRFCGCEAPAVAL